MMADSAPASPSQRDPAPSASSGPQENEAGQASKLAHLETLLSAERRTLELISGGAALAETLQDLCDSVDAHAPEGVERDAEEVTEIDADHAAVGNDEDVFAVAMVRGDALDRLQDAGADVGERFAAGRREVERRADP